MLKKKRQRIEHVRRVWKTIFGRPRLGRPIKLEWTPERVRAFWNVVSNSPLRELSFANQAGSQLFELVKPYLPTSGAIVDYGAGTGHMARILLEAGYEVAIFEPAGSSLPLDLIQNDKVRVLTATDRSGIYDVVFCLETIEHIIDDELPTFFEQVRGLLRPGGRLILSTPHNENLDQSMVYCVESDLFFHPWEHVRSFTPEKLVQLLGQNDFQKRVVGLADFSEDANIYNEVRALKFQVSSLISQLRGVWHEGDPAIAEQMEDLWKAHWTDVSAKLRGELSEIIQPIFNHLQEVIRLKHEILCSYVDSRGADSESSAGSAVHAQKMIDILIDLVQMISKRADELVSRLETKSAAIELLIGERAMDHLCPPRTKSFTSFSTLSDQDLFEFISHSYGELLRRRGQLRIPVERSQQVDFVYGAGKTIVYVGDRCV